MKSILKQSNLPFLLLILYIGKVFASGASLYDSISIVILSVLFGFKLYLDHIQKPDYSQEFQDEIEKLRNETKAGIADVNKVVTNRLVEFEGKISGVTLAVSNKKKAGSNEFKW